MTWCDYLFLFLRSTDGRLTCRMCAECGRLGSWPNSSRFKLETCLLLKCLQRMQPRTAAVINTKHAPVIANILALDNSIADV